MTKHNKRGRNPPFNKKKLTFLIHLLLLEPRVKTVHRDTPYPKWLHILINKISPSQPTTEQMFRRYMWERFKISSPENYETIQERLIKELL